jgi:hypothetical protein
MLYCVYTLGVIFLLGVLLVSFVGTVLLIDVINLVHHESVRVRPITLQ